MSRGEARKNREVFARTSYLGGSTSLTYSQRIVQGDAIAYTTIVVCVKDSSTLFKESSKDGVGCGIRLGTL